jgi:hypothetical protein
MYFKYLKNIRSAALLKSRNNRAARVWPATHFRLHQAAQLGIILSLCKQFNAARPTCCSFLAGILHVPSVEKKHAVKSSIPMTSLDRAGPCHMALIVLDCLIGGQVLKLLPAYMLSLLSHVGSQLKVLHMIKENLHRGESLRGLARSSCMALFGCLLWPGFELLPVCTCRAQGCCCM